MPVSVHLDEIGKNLAHVVKGVRTLGMSGYFGDLPRRQITVDVFGKLLALLRELLNLLRDIDRRFALHISQFFDLAL